MMKIAIVFVLIFLTQLVQSEVSEERAIDAIRSEQLMAHVDFLSDDLLEGRATATRGYDIAASYVAAQFKSFGLSPAGENQSYLQQVPLRKADLDPKKCKFQITRDNKTIELQFGQHYLMPSDYSREETTVQAEVVFAGFGVTATGFNYDDYKEIDVRNKIVVILRGAPESFPASRRAHYSSGHNKEENAAKHGAVGIIHLRTPRDEERSPWERSVRQSSLSAYRWVDPDGKPNDVFLQIRGVATVNRSGAELLFQHSPQKLDDIFKASQNGTLKSFPLGVQVSMNRGSKLDQARSPNVIGILEGRDPKLKKEFIVYSAHLDHIGITDPVQGDSINNGAYDNAVGIASLIELARAFASLKERPRRSILFAAVTAEEKGLQGSDYLAHYPPLTGSIVANLNTDMVLMLFPFKDVVIFGEEHSTLGVVARKAAEDAGLIVTPDPAPDEVFFVRSDQYSFVKQGIPSVNLDSGDKSEDSSIDGKKVTREWLRTIYHSPQDQSTQKMEWNSGIKLIHANFLAGLRTANADSPPSWNPGDFFGATYGK